MAPYGSWSTPVTSELVVRAAAGLGGVTVHGDTVTWSEQRPEEGGRREHTGLGLSIARAIVEGYGGSIRVSNRQGGGASVEVRLPLVSRVQPSSRHVQIVSGTGFVSKS